MTTPSAAMAASPVKRKRVIEEDDDEVSDFGSTRVIPSPFKRKKARFQSTEDAENTDDDGTEYAMSTVTSVATFAESTTPMTDASSARSKSKPRPKKYHCTFPDCNKAFDRPVRLQTHINSHTGTRPHVCPEDGCDKSFFKSEHLNRHLIEKHSDKTFTCEFQVHDDISGKMVACGKMFESENKLKRHVAMHEDKEETTCSWEGCGKVFRKQETLQRHVKKDHLNEDSYLCKRQLADGSVCGQAFPTPGQLKGHEAREHEAPKYICETCTNAMVPQPEVDMLVPNDLDPEFLPTPADVENGFAGSEAYMLKELTLNDAAPARLIYPGGIVGFATYHDLQRHTKLAHPPICEQCGKKCRSSKDLAAHMDIMHPPLDAPPRDGPPSPEKRFLCPHDGCARSTPGNGFSKKGNMEMHVKSIHAKEKSFVCGEFDLGDNRKVEGWNGKGCGLAMQTKQTLIGHIRTQHMGVPAALGARTGLKDKDRKRPLRPKTQQSLENGTAMDVDMDEAGQSEGANVPLSMLTGSGYEELRRIACLAAKDGCQMRFHNDYDLGTHMELTHGWNVDDINDVLQASAGADMNHSDEAFRHKLEAQLGGQNGVLDPQLQGLSA